MKVKTSITLSEEVVAAVDRLAGASRNRDRAMAVALDLPHAPAG
jgi:predicted transcriptional regulator